MAKPEFVIANAPWPLDLAALSPPERLVVEAMRWWIAGLRATSAAPWSRAWNDLAVRLGPEDARSAVAAVAGLARALLEHARRPIAPHPPCCARVNADEMRLVSLVAACQGGDGPRARAGAEWLVEPDGVGDLLAAGTRLAAALSRHRLHLPARGRPAGPPPDAGRPVDARAPAPGPERVAAILTKT